MIQTHALSRVNSCSPSYLASEHRSTFVHYANELDKGITLSDGSTLAKLVRARIDKTIAKKLSGTKLAEKLTSSGGVVKYILKHNKFTRAELHELQTYVEIVERVETYSKELMFTAAKSARGNGQSIKLKGDQAARLYMQDGASKPDPKQFPDCACCTHGLTDVPKENKKAVKEKERISKESVVNQRIIKEWKGGRWVKMSFEVL
jgi:hypothetical protein